MVFITVFQEGLQEVGTQILRNAHEAGGVIFAATNVALGVSILLVLCDYGYVMDGGRIVLHGTRAQLESSQDVKEFYLGLSLGEGRRNFREVKHYRRRKRWLG
ncbi:MAG: hypothetical protein JOY90_09060 [Bradyrhizobium sp.]|uniref:hypothetical protein n=1 Tax=Bradyrhizobium sp. TaxID=376 RepID=UPI001D551007|nr:hypothetical protein [Bradyrhizobium sp.]